MQDLALRFADGRLSTQKLVNANDEELAQMLIEVRGIGRVCFSFTFDLTSLIFDIESGPVGQWLSR